MTATALADARVDIWGAQYNTQLQNTKTTARRYNHYNPRYFTTHLQHAFMVYAVMWTAFRLRVFLHYTHSHSSLAARFSGTKTHLLSWDDPDGTRTTSTDGHGQTHVR